MMQIKKFKPRRSADDWCAPQSSSSDEPAGDLHHCQCEEPQPPILGNSHIYYLHTMDVYSVAARTRRVLTGIGRDVRQYRVVRCVFTVIYCTVSE
jgi:hypothetical protein